MLPDKESQEYAENMSKIYLHALKIINYLSENHLEPDIRVAILNIAHLKTLEKFDCDPSLSLENLQIYTDHWKTKNVDQTP